MRRTSSDLVTVAVPGRAALGECPIWSPSRERLLWVDTFAPALNIFDPGTGEHEVLPTPGPLTFVAEDRAGELILGIGCDVARLDAAGRVSVIATVPHAPPGYRLNDARFDARGRLWVGLMDGRLSQGSGRLYRLEPDATWHERDRGYDLVNGLDWSRDGRILYVVDSHRGRIYAYDHDPAAAAIGNRRVLTQFGPDEGRPDGLLVDGRGFLLSPLFDGAAIARIAPDGSVERMIDLPVPRPTSCAFAGHDRTLFVTTARLGLSAAELEAAPASGSLLRLDYEAASR